MKTHTVQINDLGMQWLATQELEIATTKSGPHHPGKWNLSILRFEIQDKMEVSLDVGESLSVEIDGARNAHGYIMDFCPPENCYEITTEEIEE